MTSEDTQYKPNDPRLIGNKFGKNGGSPRTISPPPHEAVALGEKLVTWATENNKDNLLRSRFCEWYTLPEINMIRREWEALIRIPEFRIYYERARAALGRKYLDGTINTSIGHRLMWHYVPEVEDQEVAKIKYQAIANKEVAESLPQKVVYITQYGNDPNNPIPVPPKNLPTPDTQSPE